MPNNLEQTTIQWHPGFYSAAEIEFLSDKGKLEFEREYNLSKEPLRMDLLIIKKPIGVKTRNEIGHIFKTYNVIEYKSPDDGLTIDDYIKTIGYACLYKGMSETVDRIPMQEVTVSLFRDSYPRELMEALKREGFQVEKRSSGIYHVQGNIPFDSQIVVTGQLDPGTHPSLRILSKQVGEESARAFLELARTLTSQGDRDNIDAVLQVSIAANKGLYEQIRRDSVMCQALRELMKEEIAEERQQERLQSIKNLMHNTKWTAEQAMAALNIPQAEWADYLAKL